MRWLSLVAGIALIGVAVAAVTRVSDTREGLIAEVVTLLGALAGISLLIYGLVAKRRPGVVQRPRSGPAVPADRPPSPKDLRLGASGIGLSLVLLAGLAFSGGPLWAALGLALLLPMIAGSIYLCIRYVRASRSS